MNRQAIQGRCDVIELHADAIRNIAGSTTPDIDNIKTRLKQIIKEARKIEGYLDREPLR